MTRNHADFEVVLRYRRDDDSFDVGLGYDDPSDPQDRRDYEDTPLSIDTDALVAHVADAETYGRSLGHVLLSGPKVRSFYAKAMAVAADRQIPLHLRLLIDPRAPLRYHQVRWESIRDPDEGWAIATRRDVLFSRYLSTPDWRPVTPPPWGRLKALVVIANPRDLRDKERIGMPEVPLVEVDVPAELARAREALASMDVVEELTEPGTATLKGILAALDRGVDVLYLVCHGGMYQIEPRLYLEDEDGRTHVVDGGVLADRVAELPHPPTVAVLCSCQSAGAGDVAMLSDAGALTALGPRLCAARVAAVVAMQGNITMTTASTFFPAFFAELAVSGVLDRSMAVARAAVATDRPDWWMPVLFSRLKSGRAWYEPEFGDKNEESFRAVVNSIQANTCTAVVGSGVAAEGLLPSRETLATDWADQWLMPIASQSRLDLAKVAQYLSVRIAPRQAQTEVVLYLRTKLLDRYADLIPEERRDDDVRALLHLVGEHHRTANPTTDPYTILAKLRLPLYVTTSWTALLEDAIRAEGRTPEIRYFPWHRRTLVEDSLPPIDRDHPLVYHLFGSLDEPASLVVTEDQYFTWLRAWIEAAPKPEAIPPCVAIALTDRSLLFLGYRLDDWEFRVLFQGIKSFEGASALRENFHVGVQVSPENNTIEPESAQEYLDDYFGKDSVDLYWGTCSRFLGVLDSKLTTRP